MAAAFGGPGNEALPEDLDNLEGLGDADLTPEDDTKIDGVSFP
jgi:hypothetical protein